MATIATTTTGAVAKTYKVAKFQYNFAAHTGAVGEYLSDFKIPKGAIVTRCIGNAVDAFTSGGSATVALSLEGSASIALKSATAFDDAAFVGTDAHYSTPVVVATDSQIQLAVAAAALTAGIYDVYVEYVY